MKIINQRKISVLWHLICFSLVLAFAACSDDKEEFQEYLTPASGSESIFEQGFSFGEAASSQSVSFEAGQQWTAELSGEDTGWCNISPAKGTSGKATIMVSVGKNETGKARTARLNIVSGSKKKGISVTQAANAIVVPDGLSFAPAAPDADQPLVITFKADAKSALYGHKGDVYVHIGVVSEGTWLFVPAEWTENKDKCKMTLTEANVWSITLSPNIREWFGSGKTPVSRLGIVIRSADGS